MMPNITLEQLAKVSHAKWHGSDAIVSAIGIDTRSIAAGTLFVALAGERVDGHEFISAAREKGAVAAVVERKQDDSLEQLVVSDSQIALANMARLNRDNFTGKVVGITGSAGKTTCKNMLAAILSCSAKVCATHGNLNNELGVPLTVQRLSEQHDFAVLEMGASKVGDIAYLADITQPNVAVVTNVNEAHLGGFGNLSHTAKTKGEIYQSLADGGVAVVNLDDHFATQWLESIKDLAANVNVITFSRENACADVYTSSISSSAQGLHFFVEINLQGKASLDISMPLLGEHNISNALAAIAAAVALSIESGHIVKGLAAIKPEQGRLCLCEGKNQLSIIDDSYNANPQSMRAAIDVLLGFSGTEKKRILVLGDMGELGVDAEQLHYGVGVYAAAKGLSELLVVGEYAEHYIKGYQSKNTANGIAQQFKNLQAIENYLLLKENAGSVVLVKGSRFANMDQLVASLNNADLSSQGRT